MPATDPVLIERRGGSYHLMQGGELLLAMPHPLFDAYSQDAVFPPAWDDKAEGHHPVRRLYWNPVSRQFLMAGLERHPARVVESHGATAYRSFLQGFWLPSPPLLLLRPFWNPSDPYAPFDAAARDASLDTQLAFHRILGRLRPPAGWATVLNAGNAYLDTLGLTAPDGAGDPGAILELSILPPLPLGAPDADRTLRALSHRHLKEVCPLLRGGALVGLHALGLRSLHGAEALLEEFHVGYQRGTAPPH